MLRHLSSAKQAAAPLWLYRWYSNESIGYSSVTWFMWSDYGFTHSLQQLFEYPQNRYHVFDISQQSNTAMDIICPLPKLPCVEMTQTTSFPNENHPCRSHWTPSRVNPFMSRKDTNPWMANQGVNPVTPSILHPRVTFINIFQMCINPLMCNGLINPLTSTNILTVDI